MMDVIASGWFFLASLLAFVGAFATLIATRRRWAMIVVWLTGWTLVVSLVLNVAVFLIGKAHGR